MSSALDQSAAKATRLGRAIAPVAAEHAGKSGIHMLRGGKNMFAALTLLARAAERTLDVQYYIWNDDMTGVLLLEELHAAAKRGVRVRFLLDDFNTFWLDRRLAAINTHPNIEVRLFNPFVWRKLRLYDVVNNFPRVNRRMHNKSFTVDNQATIIGGSNVGDNYFGASDDMLFVDLDVVAIGAVVAEVSKHFDRYWASDSAYPAERILLPVESTAVDEISAAAARVKRKTEAQTYIDSLEKLQPIRKLLQGRLELEWAVTHILSDDPAKGLGKALPEALLGHKLEQIIGNAQTTLQLVTSYFVPTVASAKQLAALSKRGVAITVLTNSLEATDVAVVHAGYAKWRKTLLQAGITLFEMRRLPGAHKRGQRVGPFGSAASSLHAKTFTVDEQRVFIGSFNFDQRSVRFNTEMGFVIESPALAQRINAAFKELVPHTAYRVQLDDKGRLYWLTQGDEPIRYDTEPHTDFYRRSAVSLLALLPIDWLL